MMNGGLSVQENKFDAHWSWFDSFSPLALIFSVFSQSIRLGLCGNIGTEHHSGEDILHFAQALTNSGRFCYLTFVKFGAVHQIRRHHCRTGRPLYILWHHHIPSTYNF
jgi:hypothetical protein